MSITKSDAISHSSKEVARILAKIEPLIDCQLENFTEGWSVTIDVADLSFPTEHQIRRRIVDEIIKLYSSRDWTVEYVSDQRGCEFFIFS